jgi:vacuolar-type H+-ATPase subunit H
MRWSSGPSHVSPGSQVPSPDVQATMQQMTEQLQTVIDAAERAAEAIRYDAEEQARRHLAEAQRKADRLTAERVGLISELTDDLIRHAANVRDHSERMVRALEDAIHSVTDKLEQPGMTDPFRDAPPQPGLTRAQPRPDPGPPHLPAPPSPAMSPAPPIPSAPADDPAAPAIPSSPAVEPAYAPPPQPEPARPVSYTDLIGVPPPPPPAFTPAPVPQSQPAPGPEAMNEPWPEVTERADPEPHAAEEATSGIEDEEMDASQPEVPLDAILHATRLAVNGTDPAVIATELTDRYGIEDPEPIVQRVLGDR